MRDGYNHRGCSTVVSNWQVQPSINLNVYFTYNNNEFDTSWAIKDSPCL